MGNKNTQTNTWHSGLKTTGDLYLGGNITATRNISLNGSNGSATFTGQLTASPFALTAGSNSYVKSIYGSISNSTVLTLNNLLIGQNMRGYLNSDGAVTMIIFIVFKIIAQVRWVMREQNIVMVV